MLLEWQTRCMVVAKLHVRTAQKGEELQELFIGRRQEHVGPLRCWYFTRIKSNDRCGYSVHHQRVDTSQDTKGWVLLHASYSVLISACLR